MIPRLIIIKGAGDLATGVAHRLCQAGFDPVMLELPEPLVVRRSVSFASAVYEKSVVVENIEAKLCSGVEEAKDLLAQKIVPVIIDPDAETVNILKPKILIDGIMAKKNTGTSRENAELVIGLGPGFTAGNDVDAVIETMRGHNLGKVIYEGSAIEDTKVPGEVAGYSRERLLRAPANGVFKPLKKIGDLVKTGDTVATVEETPLQAEIDGLVRGMLYPNLAVKRGMKVGDIDPRAEAVDCYTISDKARAIGGGVLEAILHRYFSSR
ncbi:MAG: selenium-dependent molybdenum cofactor biosynthesis protein YqeB [Bacillota bacterium]|nr:selenium-dependent molybdenum cofactor biosynthesis protein YqeB [Bacillota bacterium]